MEIPKKIEIELINLKPELIKKLRENDSLIHFVRNFIVNILCSEIDLDFNYEAMNKSFCSNNKIDNDDKFLRYLNLKGMRVEDHKRNLINSQKILSIANNKFSKKAENEFLHKKNILNLYSYTIINIFDSDLAYEIYFQLESNEINFETLKLKESSEKSQYKISSVGPMNLLKTNIALSDKIIKLNPGELSEPFKLNNDWLILFLNEKKEAVFNDHTKSQMTVSLFEEWINLLSVNSIEKFFT